MKEENLINKADSGSHNMSLSLMPLEQWLPSHLSLHLSVQLDAMYKADTTCRMAKRVN